MNKKDSASWSVETTVPISVSLMVDLFMLFFVLFFKGSENAFLQFESLTLTPRDVYR